MSFPQDTGTGVRDRALGFPVEAIPNIAERNIKLGVSNQKADCFVGESTLRAHCPESLTGTT